MSQHCASIEIGMQDLEVANLRYTHAAIDFDQRTIIWSIHGKNQHEQLQKINLRFNGLCEIISNYVMYNDCIDNADAIKNIVKEFQAISACEKTIQAELYKKEDKKIFLRVKNLSSFSGTHILDVSGFFRLLIAIIFSYYPNNLVSWKDQLKINRDCRSDASIEIMLEKLDKCAIGENVKFFTAHQTIFNFDGHSMLIKKTGQNEYSFFDPNYGTFQHLNSIVLGQKIQSSLHSYHATIAVLIDAQAYTKKITPFVEEKEIRLVRARL